MGKDIERSSFSECDYLEFGRKLQSNLSCLGSLLLKPGFGKKTLHSAILGAELEMYIIDSQDVPLLLNQEILEAAEDEQLSLEINRYNLEYNLTPYSLPESPFQTTEAEICQQLSKLNRLAEKHKARIIPIGIDSRVWRTPG